jgi:hypothetical protein
MEESNAAILSLNDVVTLAGSNRPLQVRVADQQPKNRTPLPPPQHQQQAWDASAGYYAGYPEDGALLNVHTFCSA